MRYLTDLFTDFDTAAGGIFGLIVIWVVIKATTRLRRSKTPGDVWAAMNNETKTVAALGHTAPASSAPSAVTETVTVVLRRQIPPRFDEPPRSWLGGLPMLPDGIAWPRSVSSEYPQRGERPLHFVAQICCADLPSDLWAGLGPRHGWLLLFIDPNQGAPDGPDAFRILHTETLGQEVAPPADLGPVHDGVYTGWDYEYCADEASVPNTWRRWPIDLVAMPNEARQEARHIRVAPPDLASRLYEGAPVATPDARPAHPEPFTRRGALYALNAALHALGKPHAPPPLDEKLLAKLREPGCLEQIRTRLEADRDTYRQRQVPEHVIASQDALLAFLSSHQTPASLIAYCQDAQTRLRAWQADSRARLERLRGAWQESDLDAPLTHAAWAALQAEAAGEPYSAIGIRWDYRPLGPGEKTRPVVLFDDERQLTVAPGRGSLELVADYYVDPARQALVPAHLRAGFEASWRRLVDNRPHRMGGYHDGVQSDATIGPTEHLLLFQLASDEAMHWCWGDVGAYYLYIRPADLQRGDFNQASIVLECH